VLVDQRGTGRSSPLECEALKPDRDLATALEIDPVPKARACAAELAGKGIDVTQYTTDAFIDDLEDVRAALAYPRINLWGGSYGTRAAQQYLRRHANVIRSVVLDGVAPPSLIVSLDVWPSREHAIDAVIAACRQSTPCNAAHPDIQRSLEAIATALGPSGKDITLSLPRTGKTATVHVTFMAVLGALQPVVYQPEMGSMLPQILARAEAGDFAPLAATLSLLDQSTETELNAALHYSVTCAEDVPRITPESRAKALAGLRSAALVEHVIDVCGVWPRGAMAADFATPVASDVPVLLLSGGLDPVTPPAYADEVARSLKHAKTIVAPGYGHIVSSHGCAPRLVARFVDTAGFDTLPQPCIDHLQQSTAPFVWPDGLEPKP
jgi:pimeloyl-ACP methyl ester carboxylesterase